MTDEKPLTDEEIEALVRKFDEMPTTYAGRTARALRQLQAQRDAAVADRERLDWLWGHSHGHGDTEAGDWIVCWAFPVAVDWPADIRTAIDAAQAQSEDDDMRDYCGICDMEGHSADEPHGVEQDDG